MRGLLAVVVVVWTLLLAVIAVELYRIDQSLGYVSAPIRYFSALGRAEVNAHPNETREQRIARKAREQHESVEEAAEVFRRSLDLSSADKSPTARPSR